MLRLSSRWTRTAAAVLTTAAIGSGALVASGAATADRSGRAVPAPPASPTRADQIQNIDQVKTAIKGYYGDTADTTTTDPVTGAKDLRTFSASGAYATEVEKLTGTAQKYLKKAKGVRGKKNAIVLDVDDTTLNTYNYEIYSNFVYNPTSNAAFVNAAVFPAVPSMPDLVDYAKSRGYTIFFLTGRPEAQRDGTVTNLAKAGFPKVPANRLYLKDLTKPIYKSCYKPTEGTTCSTIQYKSLTRKYIESRGYNLVANFGDQYSDLIGGYSKKTFKLPNPMYYLP